MIAVSYSSDRIGQPLLKQIDSGTIWIEILEEVALMESIRIDLTQCQRLDPNHVGTRARQQSEMPSVPRPPRRRTGSRASTLQRESRRPLRAFDQYVEQIANHWAVGAISANSRAGDLDFVCPAHGSPPAHVDCSRGVRHAASF